MICKIQVVTLGENGREETFEIACLERTDLKPETLVVEMDLESAAFESQEETTRKLLKAVEEFSTYIQRNRSFIPNYGERYRNGERISTGFVESAVNQVISKRMAKKQQMQWTQRGAHLLLQVRTRVLNEEWEDVFRRWYPDFRQQQSMKAAA
jgi:hypothetical protein